MTVKSTYKFSLLHVSAGYQLEVNAAFSLKNTEIIYFDFIVVVRHKVDD